MNFTLEDGTGKGYKVKVDDEFRVHALSVGKSLTESASETGDTYNLNTGKITLTTGTKSAVLYMENQTGRPLGIPIIGYLLGNSVGGLASENVELEIIRNPTGGTITVTPTAVDVFANKNFGSSQIFQEAELIRYKGAQGDTITGGEVAFPSLLNSAGKQYLVNTGQIVLLPGSSLGINITPQSSNTSMDVEVFCSIVDLSKLI